ncbi:hypothetical protein PAE9249_00588 [Paenibacillus sp. CECT 9249]|uniref:hypothetical protein n=1 Tax=Paenibacillus sp. CECT 9249 TaxID=2845385 RepID=UPI001E353C97|nr:hypothetical protein [Paenibacillus sp. CECT 9249]CAH0118122.1 hypothetical protein PAE9249_00588 [Paenibacillus sp. CECT 9249]
MTMAMIDLNNGVIDRFLIAPVKRVSFILGKIQQAVLFMIQSLILIVLSLAIGAKFSGPISGILIVIASAVLLGVALINWAVLTGRNAFSTDADWGVVLLNGILVLVFHWRCIERIAALQARGSVLSALFCENPPRSGARKPGFITYGAGLDCCMQS